MLEQLDLFYGEVSYNVAQIYARMPLTKPGSEMHGALRAEIHGPHCLHSRTLPFAVKFRNTEPGETFLLHAVLPDPCFWSHELPSLYRVTVERQEAATGEVLEKVVREFGIRLFGVRGRSLLWENKRWVLRGVGEEHALEATLSDWREANAVRVVTNPTDDLCADAARQGVLIVARIDVPGDDVENEVRRLARWAAVGMVVLNRSRGISFSTHPKRLAPNLVFAEHYDTAQPIQLSSWSELAFVDVEQDLPTFARRVADCDAPVIACRALGERRELPQTRAACDRLQRDLAPFGDFAGYVV